MQRLQVGTVARAHGLRGELRVRLFADESDTLLRVKRVWIGGAERAVRGARPTNGAILLTIEGVADRDAAEALRGQPVEVARDAVPLAEGEYLLADLPGCEVFDQRGALVGKVVEVLGGPQPILVIHGGGFERLLPAVPTFVRAVDAAARRVTIDLPDELPAEKL
jgi:16S rRNA processing protein RimM